MHQPPSRASAPSLWVPGQRHAAFSGPAGVFWRCLAWVPITGLAGSQAGHMLIYQLRLRGSAQSAQSTGVHSYFPTLAAGILTLAGAALIAAIAIIGISRALTGRRRGRELWRPSLIDLMAGLFTLQLVLFTTQESLEALGSATSLEPVVLVWGLIGQVPVAVAGAVGLRFLLVRFEDAVDSLSTLAAGPGPEFHCVDRPVAVGTGVPRLAAQRHGAGGGSRGPPGLIRLGGTVPGA